eukprot:m.125194 g.125194  ORF g.125194 m.125194 type:complete len:737 (-) comp15736_c0_seq1:91-2301(-)
MKRAYSTVEELSDLEERDDHDISEDSAVVENHNQPLPKSKVPKREASCIEHVSYDVISAVQSVIELLNSPNDATTGLHMLRAWAKDATVSAILCRLPVLSRLHTMSKCNDDQGEKACEVLACIASQHRPLASTLLQTLGPADFFGILRGLPPAKRTLILAEHLPAGLIISTLLSPLASPPMMTMVVSMLIGLTDPACKYQSLRWDVFVAIREHLVRHNLSLAPLSRHLQAETLSNAHATVALLEGLLQLKQPMLPGYQHLFLPLSQVIFPWPAQSLCLEVLWKYSSSAPDHVCRQVLQRVAAVLEHGATRRLTNDSCHVFAARILLAVLQKSSRLSFAVIEAINGPLLMLALEQAFHSNGTLFPLMLNITTELMRFPGSLKFSLLPHVPVEEFLPALSDPWLTEPIITCVEEYLKHADDVAQRLCQPEQVRAWFSFFINHCQRSPDVANVAANVLRAGAESGRELKSFLAETQVLHELRRLLALPFQSWHGHVIWMLRFASSGSERRKNAVFQLACGGLTQLAAELNPTALPEVQCELSAFFKSLTSLAGPRKTAIFNSLDLAGVSKLLRSPDETIQEHVAGLLRNLTHGDNSRKQATYQAMDLNDVLQLLGSSSVRVLQSVTGLLQNLCTRDETRRDAIFGELPLATVIDLLRNPDIRVHAPTAGLLMNLCRSSRQRKRAVLEALPLSLVTAFYEHGVPPPALADQAAGLTQHMRMAFLSVSREQLHNLVRDPAQ